MQTPAAPKELTAIQKAEARAKAAAAEAEKAAAAKKAANKAAKEEKLAAEKAAAEKAAAAADEAAAAKAAEAAAAKAAEAAKAKANAGEEGKPEPAAAPAEEEPEAAAGSSADAGVAEAEEGMETVKVSDTSKLAERDQREHLNLVFIGHVDAGKSTFCGQILYRTGQVDARTIEKYEKEAKEKNRESWFLAFIMDTNEEERAKGKTVEVGRAHFESATKRSAILGPRTQTQT